MSEHSCRLSRSSGARKHTVGGPMIAPLAEFQKLLSQTLDASRSVTNDHLLLRVQDAIGALTRRPEETGTGDLAVLVRQAMIRAESLAGEFELRVPNDTGWPNESEW